MLRSSYPVGVCTRLETFQRLVRDDETLCAPGFPGNPSPRILAFLAAYRKTASITRAAAAARIDRHAHYRLKERSAEYRTAFALATEIAGDMLEDEAVERGNTGLQRVVTYHGKPVMVPANPKKPGGRKVVLVERDPSDPLMLALLKRFKPAEYRERVEHSVDPDTKKRFAGSFMELLALHRELAREE